MTETLCDKAAVQLKAGTNVNSTITDGQYTQLINQAESYINAVTRVNWVDVYAALDADLKKILEDAASSHAALGAINFDMSGYTSRAEAQTMLDVNYTRLTDAINQLKEKYTTDFIQET
jgi:hypothetical protein